MSNTGVKSISTALLLENQIFLLLKRWPIILRYCFQLSHRSMSLTVCTGLFTHIRSANIIQIVKTLSMNNCVPLLIK
ncbi:hypothetical protein KSS87_009020, partial [Heliosperma pusillum]